MIIQHVSVVWTCFQCSNTSALKWFHTIGFSITRQLSYQHVHHHDLGQLTRIPNSSLDACYCSRKASVCFHVHSQYWHILATILNGGTGDQLTWWRHCVCVLPAMVQFSEHLHLFISFSRKKGERLHLSNLSGADELDLTAFFGSYCSTSTNVKIIAAGNSQEIWIDCGKRSVVSFLSSVFS